MAEELDSFLHPDSFSLLNESTAPFPSRIKLCRALWVSSKFIAPHKHQSLLNWICSQFISSEDESNIKLALKTLEEFLHSKILTEQVANEKRSFVIKPSLIQKLSKSIIIFKDCEALQDAMKITRSLLHTAGVSSCLSFHFEILAEFTASWLKFFLEKLRENQYSIEQIELVISLLKCCKNFKNEKCGRKRIVVAVCHDLLPTLLELHYACVQSNTQKGLREMIEETITAAIFSKENLDIFSELVNEPKQPGKRIPKSKAITTLLTSVETSVMKSEMSEKEKGHNLMLFYRLFLQSEMKCQTKLKIALLKELVKFSCLHEAKCSENITKCKKLNIMGLRQLFQLVLDFRLYQPAVDRELSEELLHWFKEITGSLIDNYEMNSSWCSCLTVFAKIDRNIVEPRLKSVIFKLCSHDTADSDLASHLSQLIECIVDGYIKMHQPLRLIKLLLLVIESSAQLSNIERVEKCIEKFGAFIGEQFLTRLSPSVVMDMWSVLLEKINNKGQVIEECIKPLSTEPEGVLESSVKSLHTMLTFFTTIIYKTPVLTTWRHLSVRPKLDGHLNTLRKLTESLFNIYNCKFKTNTDLSDAVQISFTETLLLGRLTYLKVKHVLERYVIVQSENIKPGVVSHLYRDDETAVNLSDEEEELDFQIIPWQISEVSVTLMTELTLHRARSLDEHIITLKTLQNSSDQSLSENLQNNQRVLQENMSRLLQTMREVVKNIERNAQESVASGRGKSEMCMNVLQHFISFIPMFLEYESVEIAEWIVEEALSLISDERYRSDERWQKIWHHFNNYFLYYSGSTLNSLVCQKILDSFQRGIFPTQYSSALEKLMKHQDSPQKAIEDLLENEIVEESSDNSTSHTLGNMSPMIIFIHMNDLSLEQARALFLLILFNIRFSEIGIHDPQVQVNEVKSMLNLLCNLCSENPELLKLIPMNIMLPYLARLRIRLGSDIQDSVENLLSEITVTTYGDSSSFLCKNLIERTEAKLKSMVGSRLPAVETMMTILHMQALVSLLTPDDDAEILVQGDILRRKKRKLKPELLACKKMKLDAGKEGDVRPEVNVIYQHCDELLKRGIKILDAGHCTTTILEYQLLNACEKCTNCIHVDEKDKTLILRKQFLEAMAKLPISDSLTELGLLKFVRYYVMHNVGSPECVGQLQTLLDKYTKTTPDMYPSHLLSDTIGTILEALETHAFQTQVFDEIIKGLMSNGEHLYKTLKFTEIILPGIEIKKEKGDDCQKWKNSCRRFVKLCLDSLISLIHTCSEKKSELPLILKLVKKILKLKWVRFQTTQLSNIFSALHVIPLIRMSKDVNTCEDAKYVHLIFENYCQVIHALIVNLRESVRDQVPLCNAAFRHLLKSALNLGIQKDTPNLALDEASKCASLLEKLFQYVSDNHKKAFIKSVSYVVADYICIITSFTIFPDVKKAIMSALYHLVSIMDEYDTAMVRNSLPPGGRDIFQAMYLDFCKYFKYTGRI